MRHSDPDLAIWQARPAVSASDMGMNTSVATKECITCLRGLWGQKGAISGETYAGADFKQAIYEALYQCVWSMRKVLEHYQAKTRNVKHQPWINREAMCFDAVGQKSLKLLAWLRDVLGLEQEVVTSALTISYLFPVAPSVLGSSWREQSCWQSFEGDCRRFLR